MACRLSPSDLHNVNLPSLLVLSLRSVICKVLASVMTAGRSVARLNVYPLLLAVSVRPVQHNMHDQSLIACFVFRH